MEPFSQIEGAMSRNYHGAGLGLPLVKRLVQCHGGSFDVQSRLGEGTTATVRFPKERLEPARNVSAGGR
jgi:two-component system cell cycle sensor histidine kinase PleC